MLIRCFVCAMTSRAGTHARTHAACMHPVQPRMRRIRNERGLPVLCQPHSVRCLLLLLLLLVARISRVQLIVKGLGKEECILRCEDLSIYLSRTGEKFITNRVCVSYRYYRLSRRRESRTRSLIA